MADQTVSILIDALDQARGTISDVQKQVQALGPAGDAATKGMSGAQKSMKDMEGAAETLRGKLEALAEILLAGFTVDKLIELTKSTLESVHEMENLGQAAGQTADWIFRLQQVAASHRVTLDDLGTAIRTLSRNLVEAQDPESKQAELFSKMGISTKDATGGIRNLGSVLLDVSDKFKSYANTAEKTNLATTLLGKGNMDMIALLNEGGAAIEKQMSTADGLTQQNIETAKQFADMQAKLKQVMTQLGLAIGNDVVPILAKLVDSIKDGTKEGGDFKQIIQDIATIAKDLAGAFAIVEFAIVQAWSALDSFAKAAGNLASNNVLAALILGPVTNLVMGTGSTPGTTMAQAGSDAMAELQSFAARTKERFTETKNIIDMVTGSVKNLSQETKTAAAGVSGGESGVGTAIAPTGMENKQAMYVEKQFEAERAQAEQEYQDQLLQTKDLVQQGFLDKTESFDLDTKAAAALADELLQINMELEALAEANPQIPELQTKLAQSVNAENKARVAGNAPTSDDWGAQMRVQMQQMRDEFDLTAQKVATAFKTTIKTSIDSVSQGITGLIMGTETWGQALRNIAGSILNSVINAIVKMFVEWGVQRVIAMGVSVSASETEGEADTAAKMPGALLSSISSWGVAAAIGLAALLAAMAAMGAFAEGGPVTGGVKGQDSVAAWLMPGEFVIPAAVVSKWGAGHFETYRQGGDPKVHGPMSAPKANVSGAFAAGGLAPSMPAGGSTNLNVAYVNSRQEMVEFQSKDGVKIVLNYLSKRGNTFNS